MTQRAILFTGLVRDPARFNALLDTIIDCRRHFELPIIVSTWFDELKKYPEIDDKLKALGADIVEQQPPNLVLPGHILHQIACVDLGLTSLDNDCFVLKLRPDISNINDIIDFLAVVPQPASATRVMPSPFRDKFHVRGMFGAHPFYINDITIAGRAADMRRLCRAPMLSLLRYWRLAPEQILWAPSFAHDIPVLDAFFRSNVGLVFNNPEIFATLRAILIDDPLFARAIACATVVFQENFVFLGPDPLQATARQVAEQHTLEAIFWDRIDTPHLAPHPTCYTNGYRTGGMVEVIAQGAYRVSPFGERVAAAIATYSTHGGLAGQRGMIATLNAEGLRLGERIEQETDIKGMKGLRDGPNHLWTRGALPNWSIDGANADRAEQLAIEVNQLRRTIDGLHVRLLKSGG